MQSNLVTLQLVLLLVLLLLAVLSRLTSRAHRGRHQSLMTAAAVAAIAAFIFMMMSVSAWIQEAPDDLELLAEVTPVDLALDLLLTFVPPMLTTLMCALIIRRGLSRPPRTRSRRPTGSLG